MKFVDNWFDVLFKSWSVWLFALVALITGAEALLSQFGPADLGLSRAAYSLLVMIIATAGPLARILQQNMGAFIKDESGAMRKRSVGGIAAIAVVASVPFVGGWEGLRTSSYIDIVGVPTVCYGETRGVKMGDRYTKAQCDLMLEEGLQDFADRLGKCLVAPVPEGAGVAFLSWSYNIGVGGACRSTLVRKANAGDLAGACDELLRWDKGRINGKLQQIPGLSNRRKAEHALCRSSLVAPVPAPRPWWRFW